MSSPRSKFILSRTLDRFECIQIKKNLSLFLEKTIRCVDPRTRLTAYGALRERQWRRRPSTPRGNYRGPAAARDPLKGGAIAAGRDLPGP